MSKSKYIVCPRCEGEGTIANPVFDGMSTQEMYDDMGYEETQEFLKEYTTRGGMYDQVCPACNGKRVLSKEQKEEWDDREEYRREVEAEERMLGMGRYY